MVEQSFSYVALDPEGKRIRGSLEAASEAFAFEQLKRQGLAPLTLRQGTGGGRRSARRDLTTRQTAALLSDLSVLLGAGSDIRTALSVIGAKAEDASTRELCRALAADISSGVPLERAFARGFGPRRAFIPALVAAGESASDVSGALGRAAELLTAELRLKDQLVSALAYPAFILATGLAAGGVILLFVIPSLAPLVQQPGVDPPLAMKVLLALSGFLIGEAPILAALAACALGALVLLARAGVLGRWLDRLLIERLFRRTAGGVVFGGYAISLGNMLTAGAPMAEALKLSAGSVRSPAARARIEAVAQGVRQGQRLSDVLARVKGFPQSVIRLAAIGEASGALGPMLARAGKIEEDAALRRIEAIGRLIGPVVIVILGAMIGLLLGGLLTSITHIGDMATQ